MKIYDKAKAERDVPQMMKAYLTAMQYRTLVTPDSLETDMKGLENWAKQTEKAEDRAVLYSILGELTISKDVKARFQFLAVFTEGQRPVGILSGGETEADGKSRGK